VAVARKLAVIMHRMWVSGSVFEAGVEKVKLAAAYPAPAPASLCTNRHLGDGTGQSDTPPVNALWSGARAVRLDGRTLVSHPGAAEMPDPEQKRDPGRRYFLIGKIGAGSLSSRRHRCSLSPIEWNELGRACG
jgi:hypothetical protein